MQDEDKETLTDETEVAAEVTKPVRVRVTRPLQETAPARNFAPYQLPFKAEGSRIVDAQGKFVANFGATFHSNETRQRVAALFAEAANKG